MLLLQLNLASSSLALSFSYRFSDDNWVDQSDWSIKFEWISVKFSSAIQSRSLFDENIELNLVHFSKICTTLIQTKQVHRGQWTREMQYGHARIKTFTPSSLRLFREKRFASTTFWLIYFLLLLLLALSFDVPYRVFGSSFSSHCLERRIYIYIVAWQVWNLLANDQKTTQNRKHTHTYAQKWLACMGTLRLFVRRRIPRICVHGEIPTSSAAAAKQNHRRAAAALQLFVIMCPSQCCLSIQNLLDLFSVQLQLTEINSECTAHKRVKFLD